MLAYNRKDYSSYSNLQEVVVTSLALDWTLDFNLQRISGTAEYNLRILKNEISYVSFDSSHITLSGPTTINDDVTEVTSGECHPVLGTRLSVLIPLSLRLVGTEFKLRFEYFTGPEAGAIQWLDSNATKGKIYPYVFTQSQAIHARSLFPCMDSPSVKIPYTAKITAPSWCTVLMSALSDSSPSAAEAPKDEKYSVCFWKQPIPTPSYLIALAAGNLASRDVSDRVRIWSEPEEVEAAFSEFSETELFLRAAERLTACPYQWGRYDVLCLPPSFPYGGMENPCLTFATPTLLAGDKSLADVIAHEIAHSWTGNLVTNHTWNHFWLNEGWTVWLERKIVSSVKNNSEVGKLSAQIGFAKLKESVQLLGLTNPFTQLVWPLKEGEDPDDAFSSVPYEKGFTLLTYLESLVGQELFEHFFKAYIDRYKLQTLTSGDFKDFFLSFFSVLLKQYAEPMAASEGYGSTVSNDGIRRKSVGTGAASSSTATPNKQRSGSLLSNPNSNSKVLTPKSSTANLSSPINSPIGTVHFSWLTSEIASITLEKIQKSLNWDEIFFETGSTVRHAIHRLTLLMVAVGMPSVVMDYSNSLSADALHLADQWIQYFCTESGHPPHGESSNAMKDWNTNQKCIFLETLTDSFSQSPSRWLSPVNKLKAVNAAYDFQSSKNSEIRFRWQCLRLKMEDEDVIPSVVNFITEQGRMKFVRPLYRMLRQCGEVGKDAAIKTFNEFANSYHPIARKMIGVDLSKAAELEIANKSEVKGSIAVAMGIQKAPMLRKESFIHQYEDNQAKSEDSIHFEGIVEQSLSSSLSQSHDYQVNPPIGGSKPRTDGISPLFTVAVCGVGLTMLTLIVRDRSK